MSAGKGDKPRNCFSKQYKSNFDDISWSGKISSPCVRICKLNNDICASCGRTADQIKNWLSYSEKQRKEIMRAL